MKSEMSDKIIFLDTNICIYILQWKDEYINLIIDKIIYISFVTELELLSFSGLSEIDKKVIYEFLLNCNIVDINSSIKELTIKLRSDFWLKLPDAIVLASAKYIWVDLVTNDQKLLNVK